MSGVTLEVRRCDRDVVTMIGGALDAANAPLIARMLVDLATDDVASVVVDIADVTSIDAVGIGLLVDIATMVEANGGRLDVRHPSAAARHVIDLTGSASRLNVMA